MGVADDHRVDLRDAAGCHLLCVQAVYGGWVDGWGGEELTNWQLSDLNISNLIFAADSER